MSLRTLLNLRAPLRSKNFRSFRVFRCKIILKEISRIREIRVRKKRSIIIYGLIYAYYANLFLREKMKKERFIEVAVKMLVAALTAFLTALTTTSCMGRGPFIF